MAQYAIIQINTDHLDELERDGEVGSGIAEAIRQTSNKSLAEVWGAKVQLIEWAFDPKPAIREY